jgi:predicted TIM-barrel fold metal-dependent hydrolase
MIDMHIHVANPQFPGMKTLSDSLDGSPESIADLLRGQMRQSGTVAACGMGHFSDWTEDPLGIASTLRVAQYVPNLYPIGIANPTRTDTDYLQRVESQLRTGQVVALKGYLGYVYQWPDGPGYRPYFELAAKYDVPFIFHTGDNWSTLAKVKYAHPLLIDEVAVEHRNVKFVMAHFGNPWCMDAAEVIYKNDNVWADVSAILVGDAARFARITASGYLRRTVERVRHAIEYTERPDRFLYGTDWPLSPMDVYPNFVRQLFDDADHQAVFEDNARDLFKLPKTAGQGVGSGPARK